MTENTEAVVEETIVEKSEEVAPEADTQVEKSEVVEEKGSAYKDKSEDMDKESEKSDGMGGGSSDEDEEDEEEEMLPKSDSTSEVDEVSKSEDVIATAVTDIQAGIASAFSDLTQVVKSLNDEITELKKSLNLANAKLEDAESGFNNLGKRVDAVEADTAFRKSGDLGEIVQEAQIEKSEQSLWGGRFLKTADLFR